MKKIIISALLLAGMACAFAESHLNFTVPLKMSMFINSEKYDYEDSLGIYERTRAGVEVPFTIGATAEYLYTFGEGPFGIGAKIGGEIGAVGMAIDIEDHYFEFSGSAAGWNIAPSLGFVFGDTTKKQITIYPIGFGSYSLTNLKDKDDDRIELKDSTIETLKSGAAFSWQWGSKVLNGFEIGFNVLWNSILKIDDKKYFDKAGYGFDFHAAYKLTLDF